MKPRILVPTDSMYDQLIDILVIGLNPHQIVTFHSFTTLSDDHSFECVAQYKADDKGNIDLSKDASQGGSYRRREAMGLFWAMDPSPLNKVKHHRFSKLDVTTPMVVIINVLDVVCKNIDDFHQLRLDGKVDGHQLANITLNRYLMSPGTQRITFTVAKDGIHGTLFIPPGEGVFPGVIAMFGAYPGTMEYKAALLASHGFAALALAYFGVPDLPEGIGDEAFDIEYFDKAISKLCSFSFVNEKCGVGLVTISMSTAIAYAMAECLSNISCVVTINGPLRALFSSLFHKGKTYPVDMFPDYSNSLKFVGEQVHCYPRLAYSNLSPHDTDSFIKFYDKHDIAFMLIAGLDDQCFPAEFYLTLAEKLLKKSNHPNYHIIRYPGAGHLIEPSYGVMNAVTSFRGAVTVWGGSKIPHCRAQEDSWKKQIEFLQLNLLEKFSSKL